MSPTGTASAETVAGADVSRAVHMDFRGGDKMQRVLKRMQTGLNTAKSVQVGFFADERYPSRYSTRVEHRITPTRKPIPVAQAAFWAEFGTKKAPARPFFRTAIEQNSPRWGDSLAHLAKVHNYDARKMLTNMGMGISAQVQRSIVEWQDPPNADFTVKIKGFNNPLIDEGIMQRSVHYQVSTRL